MRKRQGVSCWGGITRVILSLKMDPMDETTGKGRAPEHLADWGERAILARLLDRIAAAQGANRLLVPAGDDAAAVVLPGSEAAVITTDTLVEDVHFRPVWTTARDLGWKLVTSAASDVSAMGATPLAVVIAVTAPDTMRADELEELTAGELEACTAYGMALAGGDISAGRQLVLTATVLGSASVGGTRAAVRRAGRGLVAVTGMVGEAAAGIGRSGSALRRREARSRTCPAPPPPAPRSRGTTHRARRRPGSRGRARRRRRPLPLSGTDAPCGSAPRRVRGHGDDRHLGWPRLGIALARRLQCSRDRDRRSQGARSAPEPAPGRRAPEEMRSTWPSPVARTTSSSSPSRRSAGRRSWPASTPHRIQVTAIGNVVPARDGSSSVAQRAAAAPCRVPATSISGGVLRSSKQVPANPDDIRHD